MRILWPILFASSLAFSAVPTHEEINRVSSARAVFDECQIRAAKVLGTLSEKAPKEWTDNKLIALDIKYMAAELSGVNDTLVKVMEFEGEAQASHPELVSRLGRTQRELSAWICREIKDQALLLPALEALDTPQELKNTINLLRTRGTTVYSSYKEEGWEKLPEGSGTAAGPEKNAGNSIDWQIYRTYRDLAATVVGSLDKEPTMHLTRDPFIAISIKYMAGELSTLNLYLEGLMRGAKRDPSKDPNRVQARDRNQCEATVSIFHVFEDQVPMLKALEVAAASNDLKDVIAKLSPK
jgi:hypothetical protein